MPVVVGMAVAGKEKHIPGSGRVPCWSWAGAWPIPGEKRDADTAQAKGWGMGD